MRRAFKKYSKGKNGTKNLINKIQEGQEILKQMKIKS
jgi:hypothetical protein